MDIATLPFVAFERRRDLPDGPGLYAAIVESEILYVGKSANLRSRWKYHPLRDALLRQGRLTIAYRKISHPAILHEVERRIIRALCPPLNVQHVPFDPDRWQKIHKRFYRKTGRPRGSKNRPPAQ
jgi:excinuclease UvrABC nuclease subunit